MSDRYQPSAGSHIGTESRPGRALAPLCFEPPWPLVSRPELWIATVGDPAWGGAQVLVSEDDDDYRQYGGELSADMTLGTLLDPIPPAPAHEVYAPVTFRVRITPGSDWPSVTPARGMARATDHYLADATGEVIATTMTRLVGVDADAPVYECSGPLMRGGYGTGRARDWSLVGHEAGTPLVRLDREVFRYVLEARHVGQTLFFKLAAQNVYADPDSTQEPTDVEPVAFDVRGVFYRRDPRRWLA